FSVTNRIVGLCTASQIASASAASFFCRFTKGFTQAAGIRRTVWPTLLSWRAQWCAPPQASIAYSARRQDCEERQDLVAPQPLAEGNRAERIGPVYLIHILR